MLLEEMQPNVKVYLDSDKKTRGKFEYRSVNKITCPEFNLEIVGDGYIVKAMAHLLLENKCQINRGYEVLRGDTLVFEVKPLKSWVTKKEIPKQFRKKNEK